MPISMEKWRASVGSNNAARSQVLRKTMTNKVLLRELSEPATHMYTGSHYSISQDCDW